MISKFEYSQLSRKGSALAVMCSLAFFLTACNEPTVVTKVPPPIVDTKPPASNTNPARSTSPMIVGVVASIRDGAQAIEDAKNLGVSSIRFDVPWKEVELQRGVYAMPDWVEQSVDKAVAAGLKPLLILDYGNPLYNVEKPRTKEAFEAFKNYALFVVSHFKGRVRSFELWNEWNGKTGAVTTGDPQSYITFAAAVAPALKSAHPDITLLSAGPSGGGVRDGWLQKFLELKGFRYFDGVAMHPYTFTTPGGRTPEAAMQMMDNLQEVARAQNGGKQVDFYVTEIGWPTNQTEFTTSSPQVAAYATRFLLLAACRPYLRGVWWYSIKDGGQSPRNFEFGFGLLDASFKGKATASAFATAVGMLNRSSPPQCSGESAGSPNIRLERRDGSGGWQIRWNEAGGGGGGGASAQIAKPAPQAQPMEKSAAVGAAEVQGQPQIQDLPATR